MPNLNLTLAEGAIIPWMRAFNRVGRQSQIYQQLFDLAERYDFSLDVPVGELSEQAIDKIIYGNGKFEGVVPSLERKYHETDSDWVRQEIEQYMIVIFRPLSVGFDFEPERIGCIRAIFDESIFPHLENEGSVLITVASDPIPHG